MRREVFREIADTMHPARTLAVAEENLIHAKREHRDCKDDSPCACGLLKAAGAFYVTVSEKARALHQSRVYEQLLDEWTAVAVAYAADVDITELVFRMYTTAVTYRLLAS